jgi:transposase
VATLGASNDTPAEATRTQQVPDWIASHARAFAFFGGVTAAVVCDQLKSGGGVCNRARFAAVI